MQRCRSHLISHTHEKRYRCPICDFAAPRSISLRKHMRMHEKSEHGAVEEKIYMCADCGRQFSRMKNMEKHMEMHQQRREQVRVRE